MTVAGEETKERNFGRSVGGSGGGGESGEGSGGGSLTQRAILARAILARTLHCLCVAVSWFLCSLVFQAAELLARAQVHRHRETVTRTYDLTAVVRTSPGCNRSLPVCIVNPCGVSVRGARCARDHRDECNSHNHFRGRDQCVRSHFTEPCWKDCGEWTSQLCHSCPCSAVLLRLPLGRCRRYHTHKQGEGGEQGKPMMPLFVLPRAAPRFGRGSVSVG